MQGNSHASRIYALLLGGYARARTDLRGHYWCSSRSRWGDELVRVRGLPPPQDYPRASHIGEPNTRSGTDTFSLVTLPVQDFVLVGDVIAERLAPTPGRGHDTPHVALDDDTDPDHIVLGESAHGPGTSWRRRCRGR